MSCVGHKAEGQGRSPLDPNRLGHNKPMALTTYLIRNLLMAWRLDVALRGSKSYTMCLRRRPRARKATVERFNYSQLQSARKFSDRMPGRAADRQQAVP